MDLEYILATTHGKRAADSLSRFKPHIKEEHELNDEVTKFEESIFFFADAHRLYGPSSKFKDPFGQTPIDNLNESGTTTPSLTRGSSTPFSIISNDSERSSIGHGLDSGDIHMQELTRYEETIQDNDFLRESHVHDVAKNKNLVEAWQLEAAFVDRAVRILPGVKRIIDSIPAGRYAVATSGTKAYGNFTCLYSPET